MKQVQAFHQGAPRWGPSPSHLRQVFQQLPMAQRPHWGWICLIYTIYKETSFPSSKHIFVFHDELHTTTPTQYLSRVCKWGFTNVGALSVWSNKYEPNFQSTGLYGGVVNLCAVVSIITDMYCDFWFCDPTWLYFLW